MATQNINNFYFRRFDAFTDDSEYTDLYLASDEQQYDEEVVFSPNLIAYEDGQRLPINIILSDSGSSQNYIINYGEYVSGNTLVSLNNYNNNPLNDTCFSAFTGICDVGLTAIDNGLVTEMTGNTLYYSMGIRDDYKFNPLYYDRRFKMRPITGYTQSPNTRFSGITGQTLYNIVTKSSTTIGQYYELYGGYLQGFYQLYGYDYKILPERVNKGWTVEMLLKPRLTEEFIPSENQTYLNNIYPDNKGTFFFMGARAENKFWHYASGSNAGDTGYTRVTETLDAGCIKTCACSDTGITNSNCHTIYPLSAITIQKNCSSETVVQTEKNTELDTYSNALSFRLEGDVSNPKLAVKFLLWTGNCETTGSCLNTGLTFETGYTITEIISSDGIYDTCFEGETGIDRWIMIDAVFSRYQTLEDCDLINNGGLGGMRELVYPESELGNTVSLIQPLATHYPNPYPEKVEIIRLQRKWLEEKNYRLGDLTFYVNGKRFMKIENFEEIIPRELDEQKEKQVGVPFNISWGGGTIGLRESLTFSGCSGTTGPYIQDPEVMSENTLSGTSLSGLTTPILLEQNFGGTFMGAISEFRMYIEPLVSSQIQHNYRLLKDKYELFDFDCPTCPTPTPTPTPTLTPFLSPTPTPSITPTISLTPTITPSNTPTLTVTPSITPTLTPTPTVTSFLSPTPTPTLTVTPSVTPTLTPTPTTPLKYAYLFIEPEFKSSLIAEYLFGLDNTRSFFGFTNFSSPNTSNSTKFNIDMNDYVSFLGWTNGDYPAVRSENVPQTSGGFDDYGNTIVAYNFKTHKVNANSIGGPAWYTWIIPTNATNNLKQILIDYNVNGNPNSLTTVITESTIRNNTFTYTGSTIPPDTYRVYTTFADTSFYITDNDNIYFKGNTVA